MVSKEKMRFVRSLQDAKARNRTNLFVVEGDRLVREYLEAGQALEQLYATSRWMGGLPSRLRDLAGIITDVSDEELARMGSLKTPNGAIGVVRKFDAPFDWDFLSSRLVLALEAVRDPGNFGTILRAAAWFGIEDILVSPDCVELYNPKVIQSAMGATLHVRVHSADLEPLISRARDDGLPVYGTALEGESVFEAQLTSTGFLLLGNEAHGLSSSLLDLVTCRLVIPPWSGTSAGLDSLNVAMAASIFCAEFRRRQAGASGRDPEPDRAIR